MLYGIILAGGSGTRLWPLSTQQRPKQFLKLFSDYSMILETSSRIKQRIPLACQYILTGKTYANIVNEQFGNSTNILVEPMAKNTAPCILWASLKIQSTGGGTMAVLPSDHLVKDTANFIAALEIAEKAAQQGAIVTFGMLPEHAETGYGYIELPHENYFLNRSVQKILAFKEKPDYNTAQAYLKAGNFFWNSGMFVFDAEIMIEEFQNHCPQIYAAFEKIDIDDDDAVATAFDQCQAISIDYAIMEKTKKGYCIPSSFGWSDVGSYLSVYQESKKDVNGNVGNPLAFDAKCCYTNTRKQVVLAGVNDIIVAEGDDVILVANMRKSAEIGSIAKIFHEKVRGDKMYPLILQSVVKNYLWGGTKLKKEYNKQSDQNIAESWELCARNDGDNIILNGDFTGRTLKEYIDENPGVLGNSLSKNELPVLIKYIDAQDFLSIQVHPDNEYAKKYEVDSGKKEFWYVMDCEKDARLYYGFKEKVDKKQFIQMAQDGSIIDILNCVPVKKGDAFIIDSGTIHAIGKGILMAEVGTNSNVTYRIYDYNRTDVCGKKRELHLEKAADVVRFEPVISKQDSKEQKWDCEFFSVEVLELYDAVEWNIDKTSFISLLIMEGNGTLTYQNNEILLTKGQSVFIPADMGKICLSGKLKIMKTKL